VKTRSEASGNGFTESQVIVPGVTTTLVVGAGQTIAGQHRVAVLDRVRYAWLRRRRLLRFALWGLLVSTVVAFLIPKRYEVTTRLMPPDQQNNAGMAMLAMISGKTGPGASAIAGDLLGMKSPGGLFIGVLHSSTVADRLIDQFQLRKVYGTKYDEDTRKALAAHTDVNEDKRSGIISIEVSDRDPQRAAAMAAAYVEELDRLVAQLNTSAAHRERIFLEERLHHVSDELEKDEKQFGDFASKNSALDVREEGKAMLDAAATLEGQLIATQSELQGLRQIYADSNVRVRAVQARINELEHRIGDLNAGAKEGTPISKGGNASAANAPNENGATESDSKRADIFPTIRKLPLLGVTYADLYRQTKVQETVFEVLTQQYELAKVQEAKETPSVRVLDPAKVPDHKAFPSRLAVMLIGTFCFALVGLLWTAGSEHWEALDEADARKLFAREVWRDVRVEWQQVRRLKPGNGNGAAPESHDHAGWSGSNGDGPKNGHPE
jgi:uncharacterized protein involved in exopolysaccharide biosynthesis